MNKRITHVRMRQCTKYLITVLSMLFLCVLTIEAQERLLKGRVVDESGVPLIGVTVLSVDNSKGTVTNQDGQYSIKVSPEGSVVKFSYVGYKPQAVNVAKNKDVLNITLEEASIMLEQTVVVAMDMRRDEKSLSTAYQKVETKEMSENPDAGFLNMLSGKIAGLQVISNGPSGSATVRIRGSNSITGNNQPLYIIDGIPIINEVSDGALDYGNPANSISPDNIESLVVLKGANASALYGSAAANGAIVITTKKPEQRNGMGITYSTNLQFTRLSQFPIYQNLYGSGHVTGLKNNQANTLKDNAQMPYNPNLPYGINQLNGDYNNRSNGLPMLGFDIVGRNGEVKSYSPNSKNITSLYRTGNTWTNNFSIEKSSEFVSARFGYTNVRSNDILENVNKMNRNSFNLSTTVRPVKFLDIDFNTRYTHERTDNRVYRNNSGYNPVYIIAWMPRDVSLSELVPWKNEDGTSRSYKDFKNPYWMLNELSNQDKRNWLFTDATLNFKLTENLKFRVKGAVDYNAVQGYEFRNMYTPDDADGMYKEFTESYRNYTFEGMLSYNKRWNDFNLSANAGASSQDYYRKKLNAEAGTLAKPDVMSLANNGANIKSWTDYDAKLKQAIFGMSSIGYKDFIYADVTARNDWSSALPSENRSYFYSSVGTSFIFTEVYKGISKDILSFAKFRTSYASVGNDTGFDQLLNGYSYGNVYLGNMAWFESDNRRRNEALKPESTKSFEVGADLRFWKDRISLDFTYYNKNTKDQILTSQISGVSGYGEAMYNAGEVRNWGTEISLGVAPIRNKDFELKFDLNWSQNKSEVVALADGMDYMTVKREHGVAEIRLVKGRSFGSIYTTKSWKTNDKGQVMVDNDGRPVEAGAKLLGDVSPDWFGGFRTSVRWRDLSASILFDFRKGGKIWSGTAFQGARDGNTVASLDGRDDHLFSKLILGENDTERKGFLEPNKTIVPGGAYTVNYGDDRRPTGVIIHNAYYDPDVVTNGKGGQPSYASVNPTNFWTDDSGKNGSLFLYDASYIKLKEVSLGYTVPRKILNKIGFLQSMKVSAVGRNIAIIHQKTPKGLDPEATSSMGNAQGMENGFSLPSATYGFDIRVTF